MPEGSFVHDFCQVRKELIFASFYQWMYRHNWIWEIIQCSMFKILSVITNLWLYFLPTESNEHWIWQVIHRQLNCFDKNRTNTRRIQIASYDVLEKQHKPIAPAWRLLVHVLASLHHQKNKLRPSMRKVRWTHFMWSKHASKKHKAFRKMKHISLKLLVQTFEWSNETLMNSQHTNTSLAPCGSSWLMSHRHTAWQCQQPLGEMNDF